MGNEYFHAITFTHFDYVNATVSLVRRYGAVVCMKKRELTQDPDCTLALQHVLDLLAWASYPGQIFPVWTQVNIADDNLMMWNIWTTDPGTICEHGLSYHDIWHTIDSVLKLGVDNTHLVLNWIQ